MTIRRSLRLPRRGVVLAGLVALGLLAGGLYLTQRTDSKATPEAAHDHDTHDHTPTLDPCTLVTKAEAEAVLGPVLNPRVGGLGVVEDQQLCTLPLERDPRFSASVGFLQFDGASKYRGLALGFGATPEPLAGLGDEAVWLEPVRLVVVRLGDQLLTVQMSDVFEEVAASKEKAAKVARIAVGRVPGAKG